MSTFRLTRACTVLSAMCAMAAAAWMITGCGSARKEEPLLGEKHVPAGSIAAGEVAYMRACYQCHPGGAGGLGPALNNKPLPRGLIKTQVRTGGGAMPDFPKDRLSDQSLDNIIDYMEWLRTLHPDST